MSWPMARKASFRAPPDDGVRTRGEDETIAVNA
jgi:hypothetical protein